jgi:outer membrane lipoprotein-sorting protein
MMRADPSAGLMCLSALALVYSSTSARAEDLAAEAGRKNRAAVESIHSLSCVYSKVRYDGAGNVVRRFAEVEYWRAGANFRYRWKMADRSCDTVVSGLHLRCVTTQPPRNTVTGSVAAYQGFPMIEGDPWIDTLVMFIGDVKKNPSPITFDDKLKVPGVAVAARRESERGRAYIVVELTSPGGKSKGEYWFDPSANFLISRYVVTVRNANGGTGVSVVRTDVERFIEPAPGVFFPAAVTRMDFADGNLDTRYVSELKEVKVNQPLPRDTFDLKFAPNTRVNDLIRGKRYTVGPDGVSETRAADILPATPPATTERLTETKEEPKSFTVWLLPSTLLVVAVGCAIELARRRQAKAIPPPAT